MLWIAGVFGVVIVRVANIEHQFREKMGEVIQNGAEEEKE